MTGRTGNSFVPLQALEQVLTARIHGATVDFEGWARPATTRRTTVPFVRSMTKQPPGKTVPSAEHLSKGSFCTETNGDPGLRSPIMMGMAAGSGWAIADDYQKMMDGRLQPGYKFKVAWRSQPMTNEGKEWKRNR